MSKDVNIIQKDIILIENCSGAMQRNAAVLIIVCVLLCFTFNYTFPLHRETSDATLYENSESSKIYTVHSDQRKKVAYRRYDGIIEWSVVDSEFTPRFSSLLGVCNLSLCLSATYLSLLFSQDETLLAPILNLMLRCGRYLLLPLQVGRLVYFATKIITYR